MRLAALPIVSLLILVSGMVAETPAKRAMTPADFDTWRNIQSPQLSRDGGFLAYLLGAQTGDREYVIRNLVSGVEWRHVTAGAPAAGATEGAQAGATPATPPTGQPGPGGPPGGRFGGGRFGGPGGAGGLTSSRLAFTADNKRVLFLTSPTRAQLDQARKENKETPRNQLCIQDLKTGAISRIPRVSSFQLAEDSGTFLAYRVGADTEGQSPQAPPQGGSASPAPERRQGGFRQFPGGAAPPGAAAARPTRSTGSDLLIRHLDSGAEQTIPEVSSFSFTKDGRLLLLTIASRREEASGVYVAVPGSLLPPFPLLTGKGRYTDLAWDEKQNRLAFQHVREESSGAPPVVRVHVWERPSWLRGQAAVMGQVLLAAGNLALGSPLFHGHGLSRVQNGLVQAAEMVAPTTPGLRRGWGLSERGALSFSEDGKRLFLSTAPVPAPAPKDQARSGGTAAAASQPQASFELWHWKDEYIQPMQKVRGGNQTNPTYRAVFDLQDKKLIHLADEAMASITPARDAGWAIGSDDRPYRRLVGFDSNYRDFYLVNTADGSRKPILQKHEGFPTWSPAGRFVVYFDGKHWHSLSVPLLQAANLTSTIKSCFWNEDHDTPNTPPAYGTAGWTAEDRQVLLYDRFDIWAVSPDGAAARNLTQGQGRKQNIQFRLVRLDPEQRTVDLDKPLLLKAESLETRDEGFYRLYPDGRLETLIMAARSLSNPTKARNADVLLLTSSTFYDPPEYYVTTSDFKELKKVTHANPQKEQILWGKSELLRFRNADGQKLSAILIKPEDFDPAKKYPMIVYIYERLSQGLHNFVPPRPGTSINASYYASNGYLVLMPDICYTVGYPGQSALKCVLPAIDEVVEMGCVDEKAIGIQGHSWGGYQIAYMVTQTNRFKAAAAGAPVSNMISAYGGVRYSSGLPRQFQYEKTQSRIGGSLWQYPMRFVENSPVFMADRVQTPLVMLHNDRDGAVPWTQGIEYYLALRRLGKEVYLFNYTGEDHGLARRPNQLDYTNRLKQFFDHHLKGAPMPEWMEKGIPYQPPREATTSTRGETTPGSGDR